MQALKIHFSDNFHLPHVKIAHFEGDFDGSEKAILETIRETVKNMNENETLLIDFSQINFLNSFAVGQLVEWHKELEIKKARLAIAGTNEHIQDIFMVLGVDHILKNYENLEEAKKELA